MDMKTVKKILTGWAITIPLAFFPTALMVLILCGSAVNEPAIIP